MSFWPHVNFKNKFGVQEDGMFEDNYNSLVHVLCQSDVRDARGVLAQQVHVGVQDRRVHGFAVFRQNCYVFKKQNARYLWIYTFVYIPLKLSLIISTIKKDKKVNQAKEVSY